MLTLHNIIIMSSFLSGMIIYLVVSNLIKKIINYRRERIKKERIKERIKEYNILINVNKKN